MKYRHLLSLMLIILMAMPMSGWAQNLFENESTKIAPSKLFPILSSSDIVGSPDHAIPTETILKIRDRCKSSVPSRFTPYAHESYCACAAAATQGTITVGELTELQKDTNRKLGNKAFEKYVKNVMKPCLEIPLEDIEYMYCVTSRDTDWRIRYPVPFCKCVSRNIRKHFETYGLEELMIGWGNTRIQPDQSPIDTIWDNSTFLKGRNAAKNQCVGSYMELQNFR